MLWTLLYIQGEPHPLFGSDRLKMSHTLKVYGKKLLLTVLVKVLQRNRTSRIDVRIWEWCVYMGVVCVHGSGVCVYPLHLKTKQNKQTCFAKFNLSMDRGQWNFILGFLIIIPLGL